MDKPPIGVCIIVENMPVPADRRVWQEARTLTEAGYYVSVICPRGRGFEKPHETLEGIEVYRHRTWEASGAPSYLVEYGWALAVEFWLALKIYARSPFRILQACNPPDNIFLIALFFKLFGVRFVYDQHDPIPELCKVRFQGNAFLGWAARLAERLTFRTADVAIATNTSCREIAMTRGGMSPDRSFVVMGCPNLCDFRLPPVQPQLKLGFKHLVVYVGVMGQQDGLDLLLESVEYLVNKICRHDTLFVLIGGGTELSRLKARASGSGLDPWVKFTGPLYGDDLLVYLATADIGVAPDPSNPFNDKLTMLKILEYMASGLPIVLYDLVEGRSAARDAALYAMANHPVDFAQQIVTLLDSQTLRARLGASGTECIRRRLNWANESQTLLKAYETALFGVSLGGNEIDGKGPNATMHNTVVSDPCDVASARI